MNRFVTSDLHLNHPKAVSWRPEFSSVEEMNEVIIERYNAVVSPNDEVFLLGDIVMGSAAEAAGLVARLNGIKHLIRGNHDTDAKIKSYIENNSFESILWASTVKWSKSRNFYLSHYPVLVENHTENPTWVLHGHTHAEGPFTAAPQNVHIGIETFPQPISLEEVSTLILEYKTI